MSAAHKFILVVIAAVILAAAVLSRAHEEYAMLASDGRHKEAIALLEHRLADTPRDPDLLAALCRSYAAIGEVNTAIETFDAYLAVRPGDLAARERQAELLLQTGLIDRYLDAMARITAAQPSPRRVTRLIELFRLHGRVDGELAALQAYADRAILDTLQLERLGAILAERGNWREARLALELAERKTPTDASAGRLLLFEVLIQGNEVDRAYERAQTWMKAWQSPYLSGRLIMRLAQSGLTVQATRLALDYTEMMPDDTFDIVGLLAHEGHLYIAHQMLGRWADRATKPTEKQIRTFVQASALVGDASGPLVKLAQLVRSGLNPATQGLLAEEIANAFGQSALIAIRPLLSNRALLAKPLFAAQLSLLEGNREMTRWFLSRIDPVELTPERAAIWLTLLNEVEADIHVFNRLAVLWRSGRLPPELVPHFADKAAKLGEVRTHDLIWQSVERQQAGRR